MSKNKKQGWIIYSAERLKTNTWFCEELKKALKNKDFEVKVVMTEDLKFAVINGKLTCNASLKLPDFAVIRDINPKISYYLERLGVRCFNNHRFSYISNNKNFTHTLMQSANISLLDTQFLDNNTALSENDVLFSFPLVLKPVACHGGSDVALVKSINELNEKMSKYNENTEFSLQKLCTDKGKDMRVYCLGKRIVAAVLRESANKDSEFRANFALGGKVSECQLTDEQKALVEKVIEVAKGDLFGVDFLFNNDGTMVFNEMEDVVGTRMLYSLGNVDIIKEYADYIFDVIE